MTVKVYQTEQAAAHHRRERLRCAAAEYVYSNLFYKCVHSLRGTCSLSGYSKYSSRNVLCPLNGEILRTRQIFHDEGEHPDLFHQQLHQKFQKIKPGRKNRLICKCCLSSTPSHRNWIQPRMLGKLGIINRQSHQSKHATVIRTRADYKSEEYDITETELDSLALSEGTSEAILVEGMQETKAWWEQFPKRWVIVLLCFTAFLLCNMDRVS